MHSISRTNIFPDLLMLLCNFFSFLQLCTFQPAPAFSSLLYIYAGLVLVPLERLHVSQTVREIRREINSRKGYFNFVFLQFSGSFVVERFSSFVRCCWAVVLGCVAVVLVDFILLSSLPQGC